MSEITTGTIISPNGEDAKILTVVLEDDEAVLLRRYKKFLQKYGLAEALRCNECFQNLGPASSGMDGRVVDDKIAFRCRHRLIVYVGQSF